MTDNIRTLMFIGNNGLCDYDDAKKYVKIYNDKIHDFYENIKDEIKKQDEFNDHIDTLNKLSNHLQDSATAFKYFPKNVWNLHACQINFDPTEGSRYNNPTFF